MKKLERHGHWIFSIHLPIILLIAFCLIVDPASILFAMTSPWVWGFFCLVGFFSHTSNDKNSKKLKEIGLSWSFTWLIQIALWVSFKANLFFIQDLFAVHSPASLPTFFPWIYFAALVLLIKKSGKQTFSVQAHISPWFNDHTAILCARKFTLITTQLAVNWVFLPIIFCCLYFGFQEFHHGQKLAPSLNTFVLLLPLFHFVKHQPWHKALRFFLAQRVPLWLMASLAYGVVVFFILILQPMIEHFFILDKLLSNDLLATIHHTPWPAPLPSLTFSAWSLLWWIAMSWPVAAGLHRLYQNQHPIWLLLGLAIGGMAIHSFPVTMTETTATLATLLATPVLFALVLTKKTYQALICAEFPTSQTNKPRNFGRQLASNLNAMACILIFMLSFGVDWVTWAFLAASIPGLIMIFYGLFQRFVLRSQHVKVSAPGATKSKK